MNKNKSQKYLVISFVTFIAHFLLVEGAMWQLENITNSLGTLIKIAAALLIMASIYFSIKSLSAEKAKTANTLIIILNLTAILVYLFLFNFI